MLSNSRNTNARVLATGGGKYKVKILITTFLLTHSLAKNSLQTPSYPLLKHTPFGDNLQELMQLNA
ncbi:hypothetical protein, partial [Bartonella raoultii]|uniref:hypothetical protein n=1 Tax=Bartonella raoultii TaxID=1457020 RepID=UPI001ABB9ED2